MGEGLFDAAGGVIAANRAKKAAAQTKKDALQNRQAGLDYASGLNWDPELLSDHAPVYQRSQSPVADAFLMSLLTGENPSMVQGTRNGAPQLKAAAQRGFNQSTGGFDALRQRQRAMESATPWAPKPFSGPAVTEEDKWVSRAPALAKGGVSRTQYETLGANGVELDPITGKEMFGAGTKPGSATFMGSGKTIWGTELDTADYARLADAMAAGDKELYQRILKGEA